MLPTELDRTVFTRVAKRHISRYRNMISSGRINVRIDECEMYLAIWQDILDSITLLGEENFPVSKLKPRERDEVYDAYTSGEFEE